MNGITDVAGLRVGHHTDRAAATGCTVVLCEEGAVGAVDVRGSAPGTRETEALRAGAGPLHGLLLTGGSAFGLAAAGGVMRYLEERGAGAETDGVRVPLVAGAVLFDLAVGQVRFPEAAAGYAACQAAGEGPVAEGCVGAGAGAAVGKLLGPRWATKSGLGSYSLRLPGGPTVGALVAVNAFGDVVDPGSGEVVAGTRRPLLGGFWGASRQLRGGLAQLLLRFARNSNTTIGLVATDAPLEHEAVCKMAEVAHDGLARAIRPVHTMWDGDALFALATGRSSAPSIEASVVAEMAAWALTVATLRAVWLAEPLAGLPSARSLGKEAQVLAALAKCTPRRKEVIGGTGLQPVAQ